MIKKSMDILDVYSWTNNFGKQIIGCFIENIYFTGFYWLIKIRCSGKGKSYLKIEPSIRLHISNIEPLEKKIDKFSSFMRKHIRGARIIDVKQLGWERIIELHVKSRKNEYILINEILPRGFLVLTNEKYSILYANRFQELRDRIIKRGNKYTPPPGRIDLLKLDDTKLLELLREGKDLVRGIVKGWGLPGYIAEELIYRAGLYEKKNYKIDMVEETDLYTLIHMLEKIINEALNGKGYLVKLDNKPHIYTSYEPKLYKELYDVSVEKYDKLNHVLDIYYSEYEKRIYYEQRTIKQRILIEKIKKNIDKQQKIIKKYIEESEKYKEFSRTLVTNYNLLEKILECVNKTRKTSGWDKIVENCPNIVKYYKDKGTVIVKFNEYEIPIDIRLNAWNNILRYKKLSGELLKKAKKAEEALRELERSLEEAVNKKQLIQRRTEIGIKPRLWYERFHWMITSEGFLVIAGRDIDQNELIVKKYMEPHDIFLHADIHGAPATVIKTHNRMPSQKSIKEAAVIAACYSKAWKEGFGAIDVFWVYANQVSKTPPSGEYLPKGAFMIYGKKNYVKTKLELAIGIEENCDPIYGLYQKIIVGPEELVANKSIVYAVIVPGDIGIGEVAGKLIRSFHKKLEDHAIGITKNELMYRLPGRSRIIGIKRGKTPLITGC
ncbi:ribosome rescue protein RqcH [Staphylothermus hellenicus]|uniref:NFACT RNA-binding domain-containing protein n=1 Tax=Staphylothermus hellenicus (strain DSM 12710 / JCM 10830 / BK20S6-10-b1 / P8) TaxID=591019 RepID=D7D906_STAHD|nr:ribosome rescue protein RqcH [Staphylothermus hellenicus]ADI32252.1 protein of unknown function DUF814 [Staphylothermus hellenicus DSM 12710]